MAQDQDIERVSRLKRKLGDAAPTRTLTFRLPVELIQRLEKCLEDESYFRSTVVEEALDLWLIKNGYGYSINVKPYVPKKRSRKKRKKSS